MIGMPQAKHGVYRTWTYLILLSQMPSLAMGRLRLLLEVIRGSLEDGGLWHEVWFLRVHDAEGCCNSSR